MNEPSQLMTLGVPPGLEPVSERSLEEKPSEVSEAKTERAKRATGVNRIVLDGHEFTLTFRDGKAFLRELHHQLVMEKSLVDVAEFVRGQGDLFRNPVNDEILTAFANLVAACEDRGTNEELFGFVLNEARKVLEEKAAGRLERARG